jgi:hypothetical protein
VTAQTYVEEARSRHHTARLDDAATGGSLLATDECV